LVSSLANFTTKTTGIENIALNNSVKLYPNPASDILTVAIHSDAAIAPSFQKIEVANLLGQVIYNAEITTTELKLDIAAYKSGVYFVKLQGKEGSVVKKFVKR
jgi:hypothetical protein